jgi:uncharacterized protein YndB with AHSA1/START domain
MVSLQTLPVCLCLTDKNASMKAQQQPCAEAQMMIRKPVSEVFEAFVNPEITRHFWFTKGSGRLEPGNPVTWEWEMYQVSTPVVTRAVIPNEKITIEWGEPFTLVDFTFKALSADTTYVHIYHYGFEQTGDALLEAIKDSTGGFTTVLDGLKAYLEHGIHLNLVADKFPQGK